MAIVYAFGTLNLLNWNLYLAQGADATLLLDQDPDQALRLDDLGGFTLAAPTYDDIIEQPIPFGLESVQWLIGGQDMSFTPDGAITGTVQGFYEYYNGSLGWFVEGINISLADFATASRSSNTTDDQALIAVMFAGDDEFYLSEGGDVVQAHAGNDYAYGDAGSDTLFGNTGDDTVAGGLDGDNLYGGAGNDILEGGFGSDALYGGANDDILFGSLFYDDLDLLDPFFAQAIASEALLSVDLLFGGGGDDFYLIDEQANEPIIFEEVGEGIDTVLSGLSNYYMPQNIENYVNDGINFDGITDNGTSVFGNALGNLIKTSSLVAETVADYINIVDGSLVSDEKFYGEAGDDTLRSGAGNDYLDGGTGIDLLEAGDGDDTLSGGAGNDILNDGRGTDTIDGGEGMDTLRRELSADYTGFTFTAVIDLAAGKFYSVGYPEPYDTIISVENVEMLGSFDHQIIGTTGANGLTSGSGNDMIDGGSGNDTLNGGAGSDTLIGGAGDDTYITKSGDTITELAAAGTDIVQSSATLTLGANLENLELTGTSAINGTGNSLANQVTGNSAANTLNGGSGADTLIGAGGNDSLIGGAGKDLLTGGSGVDQFVFLSATESSASAASADIMTDFVRGTDKISLSAIDAFAGGGTANDTFVWRGTSAFSSSTAGEVRYQKFDNAGTANDYTMVLIDTDADTTVEMSIRVNGLHTFTASDFIL